MGRGYKRPLVTKETINKLKLTSRGGVTCIYDTNNALLREFSTIKDAGAKGGYSSIGRTTVCGTVSFLFKSGYTPSTLIYKKKISCTSNNTKVYFSVSKTPE